MLCWRTVSRRRGRRWKEPRTIHPHPLEDRLDSRCSVARLGSESELSRCVPIRGDAHSAGILSAANGTCRSHSARGCCDDV